MTGGGILDGGAFRTLTPGLQQNRKKLNHGPFDRNWRQVKGISLQYFQAHMCLGVAPSPRL